MYRLPANTGFAIATVMALTVSSSAHAGWLGYKNDSTQPVTVQISTVVNNQVVRGKAHVLYPGEIAWDNIPAPAIRQIAVYDPKANNKLLHQDTVTLANRDIFLSVQKITPPQVPGLPAPQPVFRLAATVAPVPAGVVPQQQQPKANQATPGQTTPPSKSSPTQPQPKDAQKGSQTPPPAGKTGS